MSLKTKVHYSASPQQAEELRRERLNIVADFRCPSDPLSGCLPIAYTEENILKCSISYCSQKFSTRYTAKGQEMIEDNSLSQPNCLDEGDIVLTSIELDEDVSGDSGYMIGIVKSAEPPRQVDYLFSFSCELEICGYIFPYGYMSINNLFGKDLPGYDTLIARINHSSRKPVRLTLPKPVLVVRKDT